MTTGESVQVVETATIHYKDGTSQVLARPFGSRRFWSVGQHGELLGIYKTRRTLDEWPQRDQRCDRVEYRKEAQ